MHQNMQQDTQLDCSCSFRFQQRSVQYTQNARTRASPLERFVLCRHAQQHIRCAKSVWKVSDVSTLPLFFMHDTKQKGMLHAMHRGVRFEKQATNLLTIVVPRLLGSVTEDIVKHKGCFLHIYGAAPPITMMCQVVL